MTAVDRKAKITGHIQRFLEAVFTPGDMIEIRTLKPTRSLNTTNFREAAEFAYSLNEAAANCYYALNPVTSGRLLASHTVTRGRHKGRVTLTIATALNQRLTRNTDEVETVQ